MNPLVFPEGRRAIRLCWAASLLVQLWTSTGMAAAARVPWTSNRVLGSPQPPSPYTVQRRFPALSFEHPVDLSFLPGSDRVWVAEQAGRIWSFDARSAAPKAELALDLPKHHQPLDGILGFTFHPGFATNRYLFINYNEPGIRENGAHVSRFTMEDTVPPTIKPGSEQIIIRWTSGGHNGCTVAFGNDGFLYISTGDVADPDPPDGKRKTGQDISDLLACVLRIDVDHPDGARPYTVPSDNPFLRTPGARPEVWAFGFRNPFRMSFDRATGDLWLGDVGWEQWEMIYRVERGGNYGWSITEGPNLHVRSDVTPGPGPILPPLLALPHSEAASITGGQVYHGRQLPKLRGAYLCGDWETGKFWALRQAAGKLLSHEELCDTTLKPVSFASDPSGELLVLDYNGGLYEFRPQAAGTANQSFPRRLSDTGLFQSLSPLIPAPGTVSYRITAPVWNDHASAEWLLGVPGSSSITTTGGVGNIAGATWFFPSNTVLARTLTLEMKADQPASARPIETQLLHWDGQAWNPYSYRWRANAPDADLVEATGTNQIFTVLDPRAPGGRRETPWRFMSRSECLRCHNAWAGETLTLNWLQLGSPAEAASPVQRLVQAGVLTVNEAPPSLHALVDPYDPSRSLTERARSWLHVNCAPCHRNGAGGSAAAWLNYDRSLEECRAVEAAPLRGDFGLSFARVIAAGAPFRSTLFYRISTEGAGRMPYIGSRLVDEAGTLLMRDWISSLPRPTGPNVSGAKAIDTETAALAERSLGPERSAVLPELLATPTRALALLEVCTRSAAPPAGQTLSHISLREEVARLASTHTNALARDLFQRFLPASERRVILGAEIQPQSVLALPGQAARGKELFLGVAQCSRCHQHGDQGRAFGPVLEKLSAKYSPAQLLEQILLPSKIIAPEFQTTVVTLRDETERSGFILRRSPTDLVLRDENLVEHRLPLTEIKQTQASTLSAMPEGLLAPLTAQEAADLLAFLLAPRP